MGERLSRFIDRLRTTPQTTVHVRILEAMDYLKDRGITKADEDQIADTIDELHPPRNWKEYIRMERIRTGLIQAEERGLVSHEQMPDAEPGSTSVRLVYYKTEPRTSPQQ